MKSQYFWLRCIALFILIGGITACSSTPDRPDESVAVTEISAPELQLPMPEDTIFALRVDPGQAGHVLASGSSTMGATDTDWLVDSPITARLVVAGLLVNVRDWTEFFSISESEREEATSIFASLDDSRPMLLALSVRGNEEHLRYIENGVPPSGAESMSRGFSMRLFVPSTDAPKLEQEFQEFCDDESIDCAAVERLSSHGDYAVVDIHDDQRRQVRQDSVDRIPAIDFTADDDSYWQRKTPAMRAFLESDAAFSAYMRSEDLPTWGAMVGIGEAYEALEAATPQNRAAMLARGFEIVGNLFMLSSPESRESEDISFEIGSDSDDEFFARAFRTFSATGSQFSATDSTSRELGNHVSDAPLIGFQWHRNEPNTDVDAPRWMTRLAAEEDPASSLSELFRMGGIWPLAITMINYPRAFAAGMRQIENAQTPESWDASFFEKTRLLDDIIAAHGNIDWVEGGSGPLRGFPQGTLTLVVKEDSSWDQFALDSTEGLARETGFEISVDSEVRDEEKVVEFVFGDPEPSDSTRNVDAGDIDATLDLATLIDFFSAGGLSRTQQRRMLLIESLHQLGNVQLSHRVFSQGSVTQLALGADSLTEIAMPRTGVELVQPEPTPPCLEELRIMSRRTIAQVARVEPTERTQRLSDLFDDAAVDCAAGDDAVTAEINWIKAAWLVSEARNQGQHFAFEHAARLFGEACDLGHESACSDAERLETIRDGLQPARVTRISAALDSLGQSPPLLMDQAVSWLNFDPVAAPPAIEPVPFEDLASIAADEHDRPTRDRFVNLFPSHTIALAQRDTRQAAAVPIDHRISAHTVRIITEIMTHRDMQRLRREAQLLGNPAVPEGAQWTAFIVDTDDESDDTAPHSVLLFGSAAHLEETTRRQIEVVITDDGIELRDEEQNVSVDAIDAIAEQLNSFDGEGAPAFVLRADDDVSFGRLAAIHAALGQWNDDQHDQSLFVAIE